MRYFWVDILNRYHGISYDLNEAMNYHCNLSFHKFQVEMNHNDKLEQVLSFIEESVSYSDESYLKQNL